jgi:predicted Zn-dependent peptidase
MWDPYAEFESATLPNGLSVYAAYWPKRPWEAAGFLVHSGAKHDPVGREGLSHFVEHVVSENAGTSKRRMEAFFEGCGGMFAFGTTGYSETMYRLFVPIKKTVLARAFSIFGSMLLSAKLERSIERERRIIIGEFHRRYPVKFRFDLDARERKALYTGHWLERFVRPLGSPESVGRITQGELQSYYDTHYTPANMSIVCVGGMRLSEIIKLLSESPFAMSKEGARTPLPAPVTDVAPPLETRHVFEMSKHLTVAMEVGAYRSVAKIPGNINARILRIATEMLAEELNEEVRGRRAWSYDISVSRHNLRNFYELSIDCNALALKAINSIEQLVDDCVASVADRDDLFVRVKRRALANSFMVDPNGRGICDGALYDLADNQRIITLAEIRDDLERVTMGDVRSTLQWLRPERRWTLITRP